MKTVFLILNYKTYNETIQLIDELLSEELNDRLILIVDNGSPNESYKILTNRYMDSEKVEVISTGKNIGYARGNNYGLRYLKKYGPQYVCIINNDIHFEMKVIQRMEERYSSLESVAILSPVQYLPNGEPASFLDLRRIPSFWDDLKIISGFGSYAKHVYQSDSKFADVQQVEIVPGAFIFVSYPLFEQLGFFYEGTFLFCEERFTAKKVQECNLCNYILLYEKYIHCHSTTINNEASYRRQQKMLFDGKVLYTRRYREYSLLKIGLLYISFYLFSSLKYLLRNIYHSLRKYHLHFYNFSK